MLQVPSHARPQQCCMRGSPFQTSTVRKRYSAQIVVCHAFIVDSIAWLRIAESSVSHSSSQLQPSGSIARPSAGLESQETSFRTLESDTAPVLPFLTSTTEHCNDTVNTSKRKRNVTQQDITGGLANEVRYFCIFSRLDHGLESLGMDRQRAELAPPRRLNHEMQRSIDARDPCRM